MCIYGGLQNSSKFPYSQVNLHFTECIISALKLKVYRERIWDHDKLVSKSQEENTMGVISYRLQALSN